MHQVGRGYSYWSELDVGLTAAILVRESPMVQKQMLGRALYHAIARFLPIEAGRITQYMLEMDNSEIMELLQDDVNLQRLAKDACHYLNSKKEVAR